MNNRVQREREKLSKEKLFRYADFAAYSFWNLQGNWVQPVSTKRGSDIAAEYCRAVWDRNSKVQAWKLNALFDFDGSIEHFGHQVYDAAQWSQGKPAGAPLQGRWNSGCGGLSMSLPSLNPRASTPDSPS
ncbi:MAG: hypothetical protein P8182_10625 [Deltaproteobacteria bacterium]